MADTGFEINGEVYPFTGELTLTDPVLIERVTGLRFPDFAKRQDEALAATRNGVPDEEFDAIVMLGLVAVAVAHGHPDWSYADVTKYIKGVRFQDLKPFAGDDAGPPAVTADPASTGLPESSTNTPGSDFIPQDV